MNGRVWEVRMGDGVAGDAGDAGRGKRRREGERKTRSRRQGGVIVIVSPRIDEGASKRCS